jgi:hypothetical protein
MNTDILNKQYCHNFINKPLELSPDKVLEISNDTNCARVTISIVYKFEDGSEAEFNGTYEKGKQLYYSTTLAALKTPAINFNSRVSDLLKDFY